MMNKDKKQEHGSEFRCPITTSKYGMLKYAFSLLLEETKYSIWRVAGRGEIAFSVFCRFCCL